MTSRKIKIINHYGIHVRPAGIVIKEIKQYPDVQFDINKGEGFVPVQGMFDLMALELIKGQEFILRATGLNEQEACNKIAELLGGEFACDTTIDNK